MSKKLNFTTREISRLPNEFMEVVSFPFKNKAVGLDLTVQIQQLLKEDYGLYIWPCSIVLSDYIFQMGCRRELKDKSILEIGGGTGLCGIVAALKNFEAKVVVVSDKHDSAVVLENIRKNLWLNRNQIISRTGVVGFSWGHFEQILVFEKEFSASYDLLLASDIFYDPDLFEDGVVTVLFLLQNYSSSFLLTSYEERSLQNTLHLFRLMNQYKLKRTEIQLESFFDTKKMKLLKGKTIRLFLISLQ